MRECHACHQPAPRGLKCSLCKDMGARTYYCSKECQFADWGRHKAVHQALKIMAALSEKLATDPAAEQQPTRDLCSQLCDLVQGTTTREMVAAGMVEFACRWLDGDPRMEDRTVCMLKLLDTIYVPDRKHYDEIIDEEFFGNHDFDPTNNCDIVSRKIIQMGCLPRIVSYLDSGLSRTLFRSIIELINTLCMCMYNDDAMTLLSTECVQRFLPHLSNFNKRKKDSDEDFEVLQHMCRCWVFIAVKRTSELVHVPDALQCMIDIMTRARIKDRNHMRLAYSCCYTLISIFFSKNEDYIRIVIGKGFGGASEEYMEKIGFEIEEGKHIQQLFIQIAEPLCSCKPELSLQMLSSMLYALDHADAKSPIGYEYFRFIFEYIHKIVQFKAIMAVHAEQITKSLFKLFTRDCEMDCIHRVFRILADMDVKWYATIGTRHQRTITKHALESIVRDAGTPFSGSWYATCYTMRSLCLTLKACDFFFNMLYDSGAVIFIIDGIIAYRPEIDESKKEGKRSDLCFTWFIESLDDILDVTQKQQQPSKYIDSILSNKKRDLMRKLQWVRGTASGSLKQHAERALQVLDRASS